MLTNIGRFSEKEYRSVTLDVDLGAEARRTQVEAQNKKLLPMELDLKVLESQMENIVNEMEYLKKREARLRDTNGTV